MKRPTQNDVARIAGVSRATVSFVINDTAAGRVPISAETRQRVLQAVAELGYIPDTRAQALRSGDTKTIGLIIPDMHNPHFWENVDGVEQGAGKAGYHLLLSSMELNLQHGVDIFKDLAGRRIDGLILMGHLIDESPEAKLTLAQLLKRRLPIVEISDQLSEDHQIDCVYSDYRAVAGEAMEHLLALHHRCIGLIYGAKTPEMAQDRLGAYQDSLQAAGLPLDPRLVAYCGPTIEDGYQAALELLQSSPRPTALMAINDLMAIGVLRAAGDLGLQVPRDLSLVSFDDTPVARYLVPRLTTASKDAVRLGKEAVRLMLERIQDPSRPRQKLHIAARLILRDSTGPAPTNGRHG